MQNLHIFEMAEELPQLAKIGTHNSGRAALLSATGDSRLVGRGVQERYTFEAAPVRLGHWETSVTFGQEKHVLQNAQIPNGWPSQTIRKLLF